MGLPKLCAACPDSLILAQPLIFAPSEQLDRARASILPLEAFGFSFLAGGRLR